MCKTKLQKFIPHDFNDKAIPVRKIEETKECSSVKDQCEKLDGENEYIFHIMPTNENSIKYMLIIGGVPLEMLIDSGSEVNVIDLDTWNKLKNMKISITEIKKGSDKELRGYGSQNCLSIVGEFNAKLC